MIKLLFDQLLDSVCVLLPSSPFPSPLSSDETSSRSLSTPSVILSAAALRDDDDDDEEEDAFHFRVLPYVLEKSVVNQIKQGEI